MEMLTIRQIRLMNEATQDDFAELLGISKNAYCNKELGYKRFYFAEVKKICKTYDIDINRIIA